ncbi:MAG TPA: AAA family ATPase, partial [Cyclobacteriaceae bacterium]|nr:AAA family ATPase [Cyclobacteriaceae bacterium]
MSVLYIFSLSIYFIIVRLLKLSLFDFKNYEHEELEFLDRIQCFVGINGSGKTNLLDAIHYLSLTKSAFNPSDSQNIRQGQLRFVVTGNFSVKENTSTVACSYQGGQKKIIRENQQDYSKLSEHVGKYPSVLIAPNDIELIWDGSELRRKFFDSLISQLDRTYLENLIVYTNHLKQRNSLLRIFSERGSVDQDLLETYDQKIVPAGLYIHTRRVEFLKTFLPQFLQHYQFLAGAAAEVVDIQYRSDLEKVDFAEGLKKNLQRD